MKFINNIHKNDKKLFIQKIINITLTKLSNDKIKLYVKVLSNNFLNKLF